MFLHSLLVLKWRELHLYFIYIHIWLEVLSLAIAAIRESNRDFVEIPSTPVTRITADMRHVVSSKSTQDESNFTDIYHGRKKFATEASNFAFLKLSNME